MEFLTIHELSRLSGVSTATVRLDIKTGKLPIAVPGKKGRGHPTRILLTDLEQAERLQYQQLARQFQQSGTVPVNAFGKSAGRLSVNELAVMTGLSTQVIRKDIIDGKLKASGGGRRGSPYYILTDDLMEAGRLDYRRAVEMSQSEETVLSEGVQQEIHSLKLEIQRINVRLETLFQHFNGGAAEETTRPDSSENSFKIIGIAAKAPSPTGEEAVEVPVGSIKLPTAFNNYFVSEDKVRGLKIQVQNGLPLEPILVRAMTGNCYLLRRGIAQYHVAKELGLAAINAFVEPLEETTT